MKKLIYNSLVVFLSIIRLNSTLAQTHCPEQIGYMTNGGDCFNQLFNGFFIKSTEPFNPAGIVLDMNGGGTHCNSVFSSILYQQCNNGTSNDYAAFDNDWPYCQLQTPTGTITFSDGTVCHYEEGTSTEFKKCLDFLGDCKTPLINFAKDFIPDVQNCTLWDGSCSTDGEISRPGFVGIGTSLPGKFNYDNLYSQLSVKGGITTEMLQICSGEWCDYVFADTFRLMPLQGIKHYIQSNGYLPGSPSGKIIDEQGGFYLNETAVSQQAHIEEITLHLIAAQKRLDKLQNSLLFDSNPSVTTKEQHPESVISVSTLEQQPIHTEGGTQITCTQVYPAQNGYPTGIAGIVISPSVNVPLTIHWSGTGTGQISNILCNDMIKITELISGTYSVNISTASGFLGSCNVTINSGAATDCSIFSSPACVSEITTMLENEVFNVPSDCRQWDGDQCSDAGNIYRTGNVGIGTSVMRSGFSLAVKGGIITDKFRVELCESGGWCDYVFDENYPLLPLEDLEKYIKKEGHLPGSVSQYEVTKDGGFEMRSVALDHQKKIEESYLYLIQLNKRKNELKERLQLLSQESN